MLASGPLRAQDFAQLRCFNHAEREAAARCLGCGRFFCRECVSEHKQRLLCAHCLAEAVTDTVKVRRNLLAPVKPLLRVLFGLVLAWCSFYAMGRALISIPSVFHDTLSAVTNETGTTR